MQFLKKRMCEEKIMLKTSEERVKLLKKGLTQKQIEEQYIEGNNFQVVIPPILIELVEVNHRKNMKMCVNCQIAVGYAQSLCEDMANLCDISKLSETISINKYSINKT